MLHFQLLMDMFESDMHFPNEKPAHEHTDKKRRVNLNQLLYKKFATLA